MKKKFLSFNFIFLIFLILISIARSTHIFFEVRFLGEEGAIFFQNAYDNGWYDGLFFSHHVAGYFNLFPRIASVFSISVPLEYAPLVTSQLSFLVLVYLFLIILYGQSFIFKTKLQKILGSLLVLLAPPFVPEVWLNSLNAQVYFGIITLIILYLKNNQNNFFKYLNPFFLFLAGMSSLYSCVITPFFFIKYFLSKTKENFINFLILFFSFIFQIFVIFYSTFSAQIYFAKFNFINLDSRFINFFYNIILKTFFPREAIVAFANLITSFLVNVVSLKGIFDISAMNTMPESLKLIFVYMSICLTFLLFCILVVFLYLKSKKINEYDFILLSLISIFLFESLLIILGSSEVFGGRYAVVPGFILILIVFRINFSTSNKLIKKFTFCLLLICLTTGIYQFRPNNSHITLLDCKTDENRHWLGFKKRELVIQTKEKNGTKTIRKLNHVCKPWKEQVKNWRKDSNQELNVWPHLIIVNSQLVMERYDFSNNNQWKIKLKK